MANQINIIVHYVSKDGVPSTVTIHAFDTDDHEDVKALSMIAVEDLGGRYVRFTTEDEGLELYRNTMH